MTSNNGVDKFHQKPQIAVQDAHASIIIPPLTLLPQWDDEVSESSQASKQVSHLSQLFGWKGTLPAGAMPAPSLALALAPSLLAPRPKPQLQKLDPAQKHVSNSPTTDRTPKPTLATGSNMDGTNVSCHLSDSVAYLRQFQVLQ